MDSPSRSDFSPLVRSCTARISVQARPRSQPRYHRLSRSRSTPDLPGSWKVHPIPLPRSRTPAGSLCPRPTGQRDVVPVSGTTKTPALRAIRGSITRLWYPLPTLHEACRHAPCKARFRLVASLCRMGVEPIGLHRRVSATHRATTYEGKNRAACERIRRSLSHTRRPQSVRYLLLTFIFAHISAVNPVCRT